MFTPKSVSAGPGKKEVLVVGTNDEGEIQNVLLRDHEDLATRLRSTPPTTPNPDFEALVTEAGAAAIEQLTPPEEPAA